MKSTLAKISLLAFLGAGSVGAALAQSGIACPTVAGDLTKASKLDDGSWWVDRVNPNIPQISRTIWEGVAVLLDGNEVIDSKDALAKGQSILATSWWAEPEAQEVLDGENFFYVCFYEVDKKFDRSKNGIMLYSFTFLGNAASLNGALHGAAGLKNFEKRTKTKADLLKVINK